MIILMKLCVSMWSFQELIDSGEMDITSFSEFLKEHDIKYAELLDFYIGDRLEESLEILKSRGITPAVWSITNDFVQPNEELLEKQIDYVKKSIDLAKQYGIPLIRVFSGDVKPDIDFNQGMEQIKKGFLKCAPYAADNGITLCLENHGVFAARSEAVEKLLIEVQSNGLRSNFDTANFLFVDESPTAAIERLNSYVALLHVKDYKHSDKENEGWPSLENVWYTGCPIGDGEIPFNEIFRSLESSGFDGIASIELESEKPIESMRESLKYLKGTYFHA